MPTELQFALLEKQNKYFIRLLAVWLAQLGECRSAEREVAGSNPGRTNTPQHSGSLNNREESAAFVMTSANG